MAGQYCYGKNSNKEVSTEAKKQYHGKQTYEKTNTSTIRIAKTKKILSIPQLFFYQFSAAGGSARQGQSGTKLIAISKSLS